MNNVVEIANFEEQIRELGWTLGGAARFFGVAPRTVRRWVADGAPRPVIMVLALMREYPATAEPRALLELAGVEPEKAEEIIGALRDQRYAG